MAFLSKSRVTAGWQCEKLLWWTVHEPGARELESNKVLDDLFSQSLQVEELARQHFIAAGAPARFQQPFEAGGVAVVVDVLLEDGPGWILVEVKSSTKVKDEHIPDAAIQAWVLGQAGLHVTRVEIMHLNPAYRHPGQGSLLVREDVTGAVRDFFPNIPDLVARLAGALKGPLPGTKVGIHCYEPRDCVFEGRCWPDDPLHIRHLYNVGPRKTVSYLASGVHFIRDLPQGARLPFAARRQIRAIAENRLIVEPTLAEALAPFESPLGFLDFETVYRAVPVWDGLAPWGQATAQFSYHEEQGDGEHHHVGWLAEGPGDPRRELAEAMLEATAGARRIVTYSCFEKVRIRELQSLVPDLAAPLEELLGKLVDLLPVVRDNVYHPDFRGSFSLKSILKPLVHDLDYSDLVIVDGRLASVEIARLLFVAHKIPVAERDRLRKDLLDYCERDTWATVRLMQRLREFAGLS
ncbi:MAG TPA: DUF2779 domain-containing protein [Gemmatimonadales bacterium]|nr:DUF2779 domain-containing protein [Gemmatimonadales bacterium]